MDSVTDLNDIAEALQGLASNDTARAEAYEALAKAEKEQASKLKGWSDDLREKANGVIPGGGKPPAPQK